jgi:hypothetical protein
VAVLIVVAGAGSGCLLGKPPDVVVSGALIPKAAQVALNEKFKTWTPAELDQQATACQQAAGAAPLAVTADFDSDAKSDLGLAVKTADGVKLVALLRRGNEYEVFELEPLGNGQSSAYLGLVKRGTRFESPLTSTDDFYAADTLSAYRCGAPAIHYVWTGLGFRRVPPAGKLP